MKDILSHQLQSRELSLAVVKALSPVAPDDQAFSLLISLCAEKVLTRHPYKEQDFDEIRYQDFLTDLFKTLEKDFALNLKRLSENLPKYWPEL